MDLVDAIEQQGGLASRAALVALTSRRELDDAVAAGVVDRTGRGRYAAPGVGLAERTAHAHRGVLCLASAALQLGWEVARPPRRPQLLVPHNRKVTADLRRVAEIHRGSVHPDLVSGSATSAERTLEMCLRLLPFDDALAVADSALRHGVRGEALQGIARSARGPGSSQVRRVAGVASPLAANPFESVLRAIALDVPGLTVQPQVVIRGPRVWARPDLVDEQLSIVVEADSFEWHGGRHALDKDARRYNLLVVDGWIVLRFSWEQVMHEPDEVRAVLVAAVALADERRKGRIRARFAA